MHSSRYRRRPLQPVSLKLTDDDTDYYDDHQIVFNLTVYDAEPIDTGLVDQYGPAIVRVDAQPIGFLAVHEDTHHNDF